MGLWSEKAQQDRQKYDALKNKVQKSLSVFLLFCVIVVVSLCFLLSAGLWHGLQNDNDVLVFSVIRWTLTWTTEGQWCPCVFCYLLDSQVDYRRTVVSLCFLLSAGLWHGLQNDNDVLVFSVICWTLTWTTEGQWCPCVFCYLLDSQVDYRRTVVSLCFLLSAGLWHGLHEGQWCPCVFCYPLDSYMDYRRTVVSLCFLLSAGLWHGLQKLTACSVYSTAVVCCIHTEQSKW